MKCETKLIPKILSNHPNIEILFTKPTKILGVTFLQKIAPMTFLLTEVISAPLQPLHLLVKLFCGWFFWKVVIVLPHLFFDYYIRKFHFWSCTKTFLLTDLFSPILALLVKVLQFRALKNFFCPKCLLSSKKFPSQDGFCVGTLTKKLAFTSKMGKWATLLRPYGRAPDQKKYCRSTRPMSWSNHPGLTKIGDMALPHVFVHYI